MDPRKDDAPSTAPQTAASGQGTTGSTPDASAPPPADSKQNGPSSKFQVWACILLIAACAIPLVGYGMHQIRATADELGEVRVRAPEPNPKPTPEEEAKQKEKEAEKQRTEFLHHIKMAFGIAVIVVFLGFGFLWLSSLCEDGKHLCVAWKKVFHEFGMALLIAAMLLLAVEITIRIAEARSTRKTFADFDKNLTSTSEKLTEEYGGVKKKYEELNNDVTAQLKNLKTQTEVRIHLQKVLEFQGKRGNKKATDYAEAIKGIDNLLKHAFKDNPRLLDLKSTTLDGYGQYLWHGTETKNPELALKMFEAAHEIDRGRVEAAAKDGGVPSKVELQFYLISIARFVDFFTSQEDQGAHDNAMKKAKELIDEHRKYDERFLVETAAKSEFSFLNSVGFMRPELNTLVKLANYGKGEASKRHGEDVARPSKIFLSWLALPGNTQLHKKTPLTFKEGEKSAKTAGELDKGNLFRIYEVSLTAGAKYKLSMVRDKSKEGALDSFVVLLSSKWEVVKYFDDYAKSDDAVGEFEFKSDMDVAYVVATSFGGSRRMEVGWVPSVTDSKYESTITGHYHLELEITAAPKKKE